jgi:predicted proteasome-type protease
MTVIVSVKINDGVIMAADSASTFGTGQICLNADKLVNLVKGLPIGVMVTGSGGIGSESISTLLKDLRQRLDGSIKHSWTLVRETYTMEEVAGRVREFLYEEKVAHLSEGHFMHLRICGYSAGRPLPEVWEVVINDNQSPPPKQVQGEADFGPRWDGEYEALNRLIIGCSLAKLVPALGRTGLETARGGDACK